MSGDVVQRQKKTKGLRRPKRRIDIRLDMTPMVDIAFLLLIFYMVSTVFSMPQAMEINLPPIEEEETKIEVKESNLLSIRVDQENRYWWNLKTPSPDNLPQLLPSDPDAHDSLGYQMWEDTLQGLLVEQNRANSKLNTLILIHRKASYRDMVDILDEIDIIERSWNEYTAEKKGVEVKELFGPDKFSYRFAMGDWEDKDSKIIAASVAEAKKNGEL